MVAETLSSQTQTIFIPPVHFLKVMVQRGTINTFMPAAVAAGAPMSAFGFDMGIPGIVIPERSIMIAEVILVSFLGVKLRLRKRLTTSDDLQVDERRLKNQVVLQEFKRM
jgi:hypothetical protein